MDRLDEVAASRCVELHPPGVGGARCRRDGRLVSEHVTDRRLTIFSVLGEEARLLPQSRLGHASAKEMLDTYGHLWPDSDKRTRQAVDNVLSRAPAACQRPGRTAS